MKRISGGQLSREAKPRFYQVTPAVLGRRRATQALPVRPSSRRNRQESARRQPEDLPVASDVTAQTAEHSDSDNRLRGGGRTLQIGPNRERRASRSRRLLEQKQSRRRVMIA